MSRFRAVVSRTLVATVLAVLWPGGGAGAQTSDPPKDGRPFRVDMDEDGIKTFTVTGKKSVSDADLLPAAPEGLPRSMSPVELAQVPEVGLEEALPKTWTKQEAIEQLEFRFAKVNYFNLKQSDGFLRALLAQRADLAGLPFKMGTDCRLPEEKASALGMAIGTVRGTNVKVPDLPDVDEALYQPMVAALMQIHGPKEKQADIARTLSTIPHVDATAALARLALFSADAKAREIAARGLKVRREQDYTGILLEGLRYPWPAVARRAVEALVRLERADLLPRLVETLEAPDPRLAVEHKTGWQAREVVRINHHRNCLLCHAPAHAKAVLHVPNGDTATLKKHLADLKSVAREKLQESREHLLAPAPLPNRSFEQESGGYRRDGDMDHILVRVDVTYLRQDFSALLPVQDAAPWPDFQRFDFLVRTRQLTQAQAAALRNQVEPRKEGEASPYHQAALFGLRELTGLEATAAADWRRLLKLPMPSPKTSL